MTLPASLIKSRKREPIAFAEWGYLGNCRRCGLLFADLGKHEIFTPEKTYPPATVSELAAMSSDAPKEGQ